VFSIFYKIQNDLYLIVTISHLVNNLEAYRARKRSLFGPIVAIIIVIAVVALGWMYFFHSHPIVGDWEMTTMDFGDIAYNIPEEDRIQMSFYGNGTGLIVDGDNETWFEWSESDEEAPEGWDGTIEIDDSSNTLGTEAREYDEDVESEQTLLFYKIEDGKLYFTNEESSVYNIVIVLERT